MRYLKIFEDFNQESESLLANFEDYLLTNNYSIDDDLKLKFVEITSSELSTEEMSHELAAYLDEKYGLYDNYIEVVDNIERILNSDDLDSEED